MESKSQNVGLWGELRFCSVELSRCGLYLGTGLFLLFHWLSQERVRFKTGHI